MEKPNHAINDEQIERGRRAVASLGAEMRHAAEALTQAFTPVIKKHMQALRRPHE